MCTPGNFSHFRLIYPSDGINFVPSVKLPFACKFIISSISQLFPQQMSPGRVHLSHSPPKDSWWHLVLRFWKTVGAGHVVHHSVQPKGRRRGTEHSETMSPQTILKNATARPQGNHKAPKAVIACERLDIAILSVQDKWASIGLILLANICAV